MSEEFGPGHVLFGPNTALLLGPHDAGCQDCFTCPLLSQLRVWVLVALYSVHPSPPAPAGQHHTALVQAEHQQ